MNTSSRRYSQDLRRYYRLPAVQVSLTLVLSLFVMAIFIVFALRPTILTIVTLRKTIVESQKTLKQLDAKVASLQKASTALDALKPTLPLLTTSIPTTGALYSPLSLAVESLALQSGAHLESESLGPTLLFSRILKPFSPSKHQSVVALPFNVRVSGSYPSVLTFLSGLLRMERMIVSESVTITREAGPKNTTTTVALNVSGSAYYLADESLLTQQLSDVKGTK